MTPEQFQRIEDLFSEACELPAADRAAYLNEHCVGDTLVRAEVDAMLSADQNEERKLTSAALPRPGAETMVDGDSASLAESIPERIGRYRILRQCGHGGMGVVYEAEQESPSRRVALKVIRTGLVSPEILRRFQHETEVLGRLQHPGIAQIFEAGSSIGDGEYGQPFFAMEFVDGTELLTFAANRALDRNARMALFTLVCDAVHHAHERGVVHRDLKPANILVVPPSANPLSAPKKRNGATTGAQASAGTLADEVGQPKILDFGVARMAGAEAPIATMVTHAGQLIGTLQYMSPEQASEGELPIDARSDVYALGVVLYELLVGRPPYDLEDLSIPESVVALRRREPTRIGTIDPTLSGDVDTILGKCLEKDAAQRYSSAADLAEDIRRHLRDEPIAARPPSTWYQAWKFARRNRALVGGGVATIAALLIGFVSSMLFAFRAQESAKLAQESAKLAEESETRALASEAAALRRAYIANLTAASTLLTTDPLLAAEQLTAAPEELRNWEWNYLTSQLQRFSRTYPESATAPGPFARIQSSLEVFFTPDGSGLVAALDDGRVAVWSPETTELMQVGTELTGSKIRALDVSKSDPTRVACGTEAGAVCVWDLDEDLWRTVHDGDEPIWLVAWDAAGERLLFLTRTFVGLWREGEPVRRHPVDDPHDMDHTGVGPWEFRVSRPKNLTFTADGDHFIAHTRLGNLTTWTMWNAHTGERLASDPNGLQVLRDTSVLSHDGQRLALMSGMRGVRIVEAGTFEDQHYLRGHTLHVRNLAWTIGDDRLLTSSFDATVRMWDAASGALLEVVDADVGSPLAVAPDGSGLVYRAGGALRFWDYGSASTVLYPNTNYVYSVAYSPNGSHLVAGSSYSQTITLFDTATGDELWSKSSGIPGYHLRFSGDGRRVHVRASPEGGGGSKVLDVETGTAHEAPGLPIEDRSLEERRGARENTGRVVSPDGILLATTEMSTWYTGETLTVRDIATDEVLLDLKGPYWGVAFSPDSELLAATLVYPGRVEIWNVRSREKLTELTAHGSHAYCVAFHPDGTRLASGGNDNTIRLWDTMTWEQVLELRGHTSYVMALDFRPDGTQLASGSGDLTVRVWDSVPRDERLREAQGGR